MRSTSHTRDGSERGSLFCLVESLASGGLVSLGGTIVCGVNDSTGACDALQLAAALRDRLGLRLVVAHVAAHADGGRSSQRSSAEQLFARVVEQAAIRGPMERRSGVGDRAGRLAQIAAEEGADIIILGSPRERRPGWRRRLTLARALEGATSCPVVIAPPQTRRRSQLRLAQAESVRAS
jgi:nucleotide-binding universal stress UspA family protein